jgi:hypothetical protein
VPRERLRWGEGFARWKQFSLLAADDALPLCCRQTIIRRKHRQAKAGSASAVDPFEIQAGAGIANHFWSLDELVGLLGQDAGSDSVNLILGTGYAAIGLALVVWATPLSIRYNAWTTGLRERHPHVNPPPTPQWRARNTKIMTVMFRVVGVFLVLLSIMYLWPLIVTKPH